MNATRDPAPDPRLNRLLAALPNADRAQWQQYLEAVELRAGQVLSESGSTSAHAYFPTTAIVSLLYRTENGAAAEIAVVGNDGVVGMSLFMGGAATPGQAVVQSAGLAYRISAHAVRDLGQRAGPALAMMLRYAQAMIAQVAQTAVCNRYHSIEQQFARRLLVGLDRSTSDELVMTQEGVAQLLGVRREGVTAAALRLQEAGVIRYRRGHIAVLDRARLEQQACECYGVTRREYDRLLPAPPTGEAQRGASFGGLHVAGPPHGKAVPVPQPATARPVKPQIPAVALHSLTLVQHRLCTAPTHSGPCCAMPA